MQRHFAFSLGEYYHLYNRGVEKRNIFLDENDQSRFIRLLFAANGSRPFVFREIEHKRLSEINRGSNLTAIGAYALMPNHFHLLARETVEGGITSFMEKLLTGYSAYFNKRNQRVGPLFQGTFKAQHVDNNEYLKYLYSYIHLNPIKLIDPHWRDEGIKNRYEAKQFLETYAHSSYPDYIGTIREQSLILSKDLYPAYFTSSRKFDDFLNEWLAYKDFAEIPST